MYKPYKMTLKRLVTCAACIFIFSKTWAQSIADSASNSPYISAAKFYSAITDRNQQLYNGPEYIWSYTKSTGHPFYITDAFQLGSIRYDDVSYFDIPIQYELVKNVVIIKGANDERIELASDRISAFSVGNSVFKKVNSNNLPGLFYQSLYNSKGIEVLAARKKSFIRGGKAEDLDVFQEADSYYIGKGEQYYLITEAADLYKSFVDKEKLLKSFAREKKLSFRKDPQTYILEIVAYYNSIP